MKKRDILFWIFGLLQTILLAIIVSDITNTLRQIAYGKRYFDVIEWIMLFVFLLSILGIEYLIYSKK